MDVTTAAEHRHLRRSATLAVAASAMSVALLATGAVLQSAASSMTGDDVFFVVSAVATLAVGLVLVVRRPRNRTGWIVCALAWQMSAQSLLGGIIESEPAPGALTTAALWIDGRFFLVLWGGLTVLFLHFPTGRVPSPRWVWPTRAAVAAIGFAFLMTALEPGALREGLPASATNPLNPTAVSPAVWEVIEPLSSLALVLLTAALLMALWSLVVRYRSSPLEQRLQIRWVVTAAVVFVCVLMASVVVRHAVPRLLPAADLASGAAFLLLPLSVGVAVLRYRLYEIDRLINRTVVYTIVSVVLAAAYVAAVAAMRSITAPVTGDTAVAVAASTLAVAALFRPLRGHVQAAVDRRFNRARYDAARTVEQFSARLRDEVDLETLKVELVRVVCATMEPAGTTLWLREAGR